MVERRCVRLSSREPGPCEWEGGWAWSLGGASLNSPDPWKLETVLWGQEKSKGPNYKKPLSGRSRQTDRHSLSGSPLASVTYQSRLSGGPCL